MRVAYVNGEYVSQSRAQVSIDDRGFQFADGIYEVVALIKGRWIDLDLHLMRLYRSCQELDLPFCHSMSVLMSIIIQLQRRNRLSNGLLYIQVTRGVAPRGHIFPFNASPTLLMTLKPFKFASQDDDLQSVAVITYPENRWARPDIKSTSLLANVLAKQKAHFQKAYEAIYINSDGWVTEGSHSNVWIVNQEGALQTHPPTQQILNGITRQRLILLLSNTDIKIQEQPFNEYDLKNAREVFLTGTTTFIKPVDQIDDVKINVDPAKSLVSFLSQKYLEYCGL
ncbi:MAG: aminotransferase class IV [Janthinobacterium lividum]